MHKALELFRELARRAVAEDRWVLFEHELYSVLEAAKMAVPAHLYLPRGEWKSVSSALGDGPVVLKVISRDILHKSDVGGVQFADAKEVIPELLATFHAQVAARYQAIHGRCPSIDGTLIARRIQYDRARLASETILGMKWKEEFGFVVLVGLGGVKAEFLAGSIDDGGSALYLPLLEATGALPAILRETTVYRDLSGLLRGSEALIEDSEWLRWTEFFSHLAGAFPVVGSKVEEPVLVEIEFNPVVADISGRLVALDALARLQRGLKTPLPRPSEKLMRFFRPGSIAIAGVSSKGINMGRVILRNLLRDNFPREEIFLIKPGDTEIDGVRCFPQVADLPKRVDLAVLAVGAAAIPALVEQITTARKAECLIVIPGGMAEKKGGEALQDRIALVLESSRREDWRGPLLCGPNSMGVLSIPGGYDTTFIPETKFPKPEAAIRNVAYISQSGAFMLSRISNVPEIAPRYMVSAGNQVDLTISDYVSHLKDDPEVHVLAVYVEGFQPLDGWTFLREARQAIDIGKTVVLYKGGRSAEGQGAAAGHTASIAGDYRVTRALARSAGMLVADTLCEFEAYVRLSCLLRDKRIRGGRVALMSNAGFQTVAMADSLHQGGRTLSLAMLAPATLDRLKALLSPSGIDALINIGNPLDITPSAGDKLFCECVRCLLEDDGVDAMIAGVVPFAPAMSTLESSPNPAELITHPDSMAYRLPELAAETSKPLVAVIEGGRTYDALVHVLQIEGLPVFRIADEGIRALGSYLAFRLQPHRA